MNTTNPTIYIVPRLRGSANSDWYPWFEEQVRITHQLNLTILPMPNWNQPDVEEVIHFLSSEVGEPGRSTFFIGHSIGCQAILKLLLRKVEKEPTLKIGGLLFVAAWFTVDTPWSTLVPWIDTRPLTYTKVSGSVEQKKVIISTNDPFTTDYQANGQLWKERLGADVHIIPDKAHFNQPEQKEVLQEFNKMIETYSKID